MTAPMTAKVARDEYTGLTVLPTWPIRRLGRALGLGIIGELELLLVYALLRPGLPSTIPPGFATPGLNLPFDSTVGLVQGVALTIALVTLVFCGLVLLTGDLEPSEWSPFGRKARVDPVLTIEATMVSIGLPGTVVVLLTGAAGDLPGNIPPGPFALAIGTLPLLAAACLVVYLRLFADE